MKINVIFSKLKRLHLISNVWKLFSLNSFPIMQIIIKFHFSVISIFSKSINEF